jgi:hypothetical protein
MTKRTIRKKARTVQTWLNFWRIPARVSVKLLPYQLVDVLLLMESHRQSQEEQEYFLPAFVRYWLLFVVDWKRRPTSFSSVFV